MRQVSVWILVVCLIVAVGCKEDPAETARKSQRAEQELNSIKNNIEMYRLSKRGKLPRTLDDLVSMKLLGEVPSDPWGQPYLYEPTGEGATLSSKGADGEKGTKDDVKVELK